jgi:hypothetical protein
MSTSERKGPGGRRGGDRIHTGRPARGEGVRGRRPPGSRLPCRSSGAMESAIPEGAGGSLGRRGGSGTAPARPGIAQGRPGGSYSALQLSSSGFKGIKGSARHGPGPAPARTSSGPDAGAEATAAFAARAGQSALTASGGASALPRGKPGRSRRPPPREPYGEAARSRRSRKTAAAGKSRKPGKGPRPGNPAALRRTP